LDIFVIANFKLKLTAHEKNFHFYGSDAHGPDGNGTDATKINHWTQR